MVDKKIVAYLKEYRSRGYSVETLRDFLVQQGRNPDEVDLAIRSLDHSFHLQWWWYVLIALVLLIIFTGAFFLIGKDAEERIDIALSAFPQTQTINVGEQLIFKVSFPNTGEKQNIPVSIQYEISHNNQVEQRVAEVVQDILEEKTYTYPPQQTGTYEVSITLTHEQGIETTSFSVNVNSVCGDNTCHEEEICLADCEKTSDDPVIEQPPVEDPPVEKPEEAFCGDDICQANENFLSCEKDCPPPICGNNQCEEGETEDNCELDCLSRTSITDLTEYEITLYIPEQSRTKDPSTLANECNSLSDQQKKDTCFFWVMKESKQSLYCKFIEQQVRKDDCYVTYAFSAKDFAACEEVTDAYKREVCEQLE